MNIIFLDAVQDYGGSQKSTISLIKNINQNKKHNTLYVDFWGTDTQLLENLKLNNIEFSILNKRDNPIVINEHKGLFSLFKSLLIFMSNVVVLRREFDKIITDFKPDIVIINNLKSISILNAKKDYRIIFFERTWFAQIKISLLKKYLFSKVDYFLAVSNATKHAIYSKRVANLDKIYTLPNYININKEYKAIEKPLRKVKILNCGGYLKTKGLHHTLQIANILKNKNISFEINIVGVLYKGQESIDYYHELQSYIIENNLTNHVYLHKNIKDMKPFFEKADILIHPTYSEGLPRVIMEAMSYSIPVIANSVGGVNDYILDGFTGFLTDFNNIDKFVDKIILLKNDINVYNFISQNAFRLIETSYSEKIQYDNFQNILKNLI